MSVESLSGCVTNNNISNIDFVKNIVVREDWRVFGLPKSLLLTKHQKKNPVYKEEVFKNTGNSKINV